jgi:pimeloyl-ACP methyl ester carboxylesterase
MPSPPPPAPPPPPLKILMLHGYTQSGALFRGKTRALEKNLLKAFPAAGCKLIYPTAPMRLARPDVPGLDGTGGNAVTEVGGDDGEPDAWAWWRRKGDGEPFAYEGLEEGLARVAEVLRTDGPFDGVVGFSQGGALAGMVASLLEEGKMDVFERAAARAVVAVERAAPSSLSGHVYTYSQAAEVDRLPRDSVRSFRGAAI